MRLLRLAKYLVSTTSSSVSSRCKMCLRSTWCMVTLIGELRIQEEHDGDL